MIEIEEEYKLLEWIKHLQDEYASGAWNKDDDVKFKQILQDHEKARKWDESLLGSMLKRDETTVGDYMQALKLRKLVESAIKECKENAGGMEYGMALEKLLEDSK